jgi:hypothetical protein
MPQQPGTPEYEETVAPENPPNAVLRPAARTAALVTFLGGIVLLFVLIGAVLFYWKVADRPGDDGRPASIGTTGEPRSDEAPGGFDPTPDADNTRDELKHKGVDEPKQGPTPGLTSGATKKED